MTMPKDLAAPSEDSYKKKQRAMQGRLRKLDTKNPVVKKAIKKNEPKRDAYEDFDIVHELVSAAYAEYADGDSKKSLHDCFLNLADAIRKAANGLSSDNRGSSSSNDEDVDPDDYDD